MFQAFGSFILIVMALILYWILVPSAQALPGGCSANLGQIAAQMSLIQKTMQIDDDDRRTEDEYADDKNNDMTIEEVHRKFGATGKLDCPGNAKGSANVTVVNDLITTSAHNFYDPKTCQLIRDPKQCKFTIGSESTSQTIEILGLEEKGFNCPESALDKDDWAVLKLANPAKGIEPYQLPANRVMPVSPRDTIVAVASRSHDFVRRGEHPKSIGNCGFFNKQLREDGSLGYLYTNCDMGKGGSGGAILNRRPGKMFELAAIIDGGTETDAQVELERKTGNPIKDKYSPTWHSGGVAVTGKFRLAIESASGLVPK